MMIRKVLSRLEIHGNKPEKIGLVKTCVRLPQEQPKDDQLLLHILTNVL
jgi:hypothetical protein